MTSSEHRDSKMAKCQSREIDPVQDYKRFSPVWAKVKGYPWWPAKILEIDLNKDKHYTVIFYPDNSIAYLNQIQLRPFWNEPQKIIVSDTQINQDWKKAREDYRQLLKSTQQQHREKNKTKKLAERTEQQKGTVESIASKQIKKEDIKRNTPLKYEQDEENDEQEQHNSKQKNKRNGVKFEKSENIKTTRKSVNQDCTFSLNFEPEQNIIKQINKPFVIKSKQQDYQLKLLNAHRKGIKIDESHPKWVQYCRVKRSYLKVLTEKGLDRKKALRLVVKIWLQLIENQNKNEAQVEAMLRSKPLIQIVESFS